MLRTACTLGVVGLLVAGCGTTPIDRTASGAGIGAAAGTVVGAVTGLTLLEGAAIGAVVGGATGLLTDADKVNLGKPPWASSEGGTAPHASVSPTAPTASVAPTAPTASVAPTTPPAAPAAVDADLVRWTQANLKRLGYDPGPVDGVLGAKTRAAITAYQTDNGLVADGRPTPGLAAALRARADKEAELRAALF